MTTKSDSNGTWMLKNVVPATYVVKVDLPPDVVLTRNGKTELTVTITNETMKVLLMPTTVTLGSVEGIVFYDTNGDSTLGNSENDIPSTVVTLKNSNGVIIATTTSDSSEKYIFNNVMPGNKVISLESPSKYELQITVVVGKVTTVNIDLTVLTGTVAGLVLQGGDTKLPISGITIEMYSETGSSFQTVTDSSRKYVFPPVQPGSYNIKPIIPEGFYVQKYSSGVIPVVIESSKTTDVPTELAPMTGSIEGAVYNNGSIKTPIPNVR